MVEQYRSLHIHSKDSLKHVVILKMHVLTVVKSTILYILTQDLHWRCIYIKKHLETELHTLSSALPVQAVFTIRKVAPTLVGHSNIPRAPILGTRGKGKFGSQVKAKMKNAPLSSQHPLERMRNQNKKIWINLRIGCLTNSHFDFREKIKILLISSAIQQLTLAVPDNYFFFQKNKV